MPSFPHPRPQPPQLFGSAWRSAQPLAQQTPLSAIPSALQGELSAQQLPLQQMPASPHETPQLPQFWGSVVVSTQGEGPPQFSYAGAHWQPASTHHSF